MAGILKHKKKFKIIFSMFFLCLLLIIIILPLLRKESISKLNQKKTNWRIETIDSNIIVFYDFLLDSNGNAHVIYKKDINIVYAQRIEEKWKIEILEFDCTNPVVNSVAIDKNGYLHVGYFDMDNRHFKLLKFTGNNWNISIIDAIHYLDYSSSMLIEESGEIHICYKVLISYNSRILKYANWNLEFWETKIIDDPYPGRHVPKIKLGDNSNPYLFYYDIDSSNLRYQKFINQNWKSKEIKMMANYSILKSICFDSQNTPHIYYFDNSTNKINYAYLNNNNWSIIPVETLDMFGNYYSMDLDSKKYPHLTYYNSYYERIEYVYWNGTNWSFEEIESFNKNRNYKKEIETQCGTWTYIKLINNMVLDDNDHPHVCYYFIGRNNYEIFNFNNLNYAKCTNEKKNGITKSLPSFDGAMIIILVFFFNIGFNKSLLSRNHRFYF